jgi:hypothetical protein
MIDIQGKEDDNIVKTPYLAYYILIIIGLLCAIYFLSNYTCNIANLNYKENFESTNGTTDETINGTNSTPSITSSSTSNKTNGNTSTSSESNNSSDKIVISDKYPPICRSTLILIVLFVTIFLILTFGLGYYMYHLYQYQQFETAQMTQQMGRQFGLMGPQTSQPMSQISQQMSQPIGQISQPMGQIRQPMTQPQTGYGIPQGLLFQTN